MGRLKTQRSLSGIYFRHQNPETGKWESWCFEDLSEEEQREMLSKKEPEFLIGMCVALAETINVLGEEFDIGIKE
jgi:hypothetical protein